MGGGGEQMARWDVFLAHASADKDRVRPLVGALRGLGLQVFFDEDSVALGKEWDIEIPRAQAASTATVAAVSAAYVAAFYERAEVHDAIRLKRAGGHLLIPLYLDGPPGADDVFYGLSIVQGLWWTEVAEVARRLAEAVREAPPVAPRPALAPEPTQAAALYAALCGLGEARFEEVVRATELPPSTLLPRTVPQNRRAINLNERLSEAEGGLEVLAAALTERPSPPDPAEVPLHDLLRHCHQLTTVSGSPHGPPPLRGGRSLAAHRAAGPHHDQDRPTGGTQGRGPLDDLRRRAPRRRGPPREAGGAGGGDEAGDRRRGGADPRRGSATPPVSLADRIEAELIPAISGQLKRAEPRMRS